MSLQEIIFIVLSIVSIVTALGVIISKNPVNSVLSLIVLFFSITCHYIMLNAQFLAIVNFIVYMGAIMVLFLFVIMLLNLNAELEPQKRNWLKYAGAISGGALLLVITGVLRSASMASLDMENASEIGLIQNLGHTLFSQYVVPFEISSILFLTAMVGAVVLGKKD
ncbi:NADH-quinone oxidoreductase subunit J [Chitinophaga horti]|uniref:NADH-quinone oxidoreductase subunit J n=1 Tax=Chitinophaga horti TaxID=2920382 RepID=A0ABY6J1L0_9BACT|nr:NADH-quinone oxidoreductase subunit J [Chitinophaga horti]UYQ93448.1 NADH-quinone oxidoreductase subunit J [Chitinophaga horti]